MDINKTLESQYYEKSLTLFNRAGEELLADEILNCIKQIGSKVEQTLRSDMNDEQKSDTLIDLPDFINVKLSKNLKFVDLMREFIKEKNSNYNTAEKNEKKTEDNLENSISLLNNLSLEIQKNIIKLKEHKETIEGMIDLISIKTLKTAKKILKDVKDEFLDDKSIIVTIINKINSLKSLINENKDKINLDLDLKENVYGQQGEFLSESETNEIIELIEEIEKIIINFDFLIKDKEQEILVQEVKDKREKDSFCLENLDTESIEYQYIKEILELYDSIDKNRVISAIRHLYNWIEGILEDESIDYKKKKEIFKNPLIAFNPNYLKNNEKAIGLLKIIIELKIKEGLDKITNDEYNMVFAIPSKCQGEIINQLKNIVNKYSDEGRNLNRKAEIKNKCEVFIKQLDKVIPDLLRNIEERNDISKFKVNYVIPILIEIGIPKKFYEDFMVIVDIYNKEKKESLIDLAKKEMFYKNKLNLSYLDLKDAISSCPINLINICEKCLIFIQNNLPGKISEDIAIEKEAERRSLKKNPNDKDETSNIVMKMQNLGNQRKRNEIIIDDPVIVSAKEFVNSESQKIKRNILNSESIGLSQKLLNRTTNFFLDKYPNIPLNVKEKLKPFIENYYLYLKNIMLINQRTTSKIINEIREEKLNLSNI
ncbi:MAG: hypothetical protein PHN31_02370 [Candidatus Gracilibacteria bacterium]|nr:hypothetical protein [Candidatus Gracilibacteria bacterium]